MKLPEPFAKLDLPNAGLPTKVALPAGDKPLISAQVFPEPLYDAERVASKYNISPFVTGFAAVGTLSNGKVVKLCAVPYAVPIELVA